jgi:arylsulfatase A-like enzyme/tetratricopeptide (TPR) repeat protein
LALAVAVGAWWLVPRTPPIDLIVITLDTTRADRLGCYGYAAADTPTLDRLAREGVVFDRCFSPAPLTLPVHATLWTGLNPPEHGLRTNGRGALPKRVATFAEVLKKAGYQTAAMTSSFVLDSRFGLNRGFDVYDDDLPAAEGDDVQLHQQRDGRDTVDQALKWLSSLGSQSYFCWVHLYDPHYPYLAHEDVFGETFRERPYDAELAYVDRQIARLLDFVASSGRADRTVVVIVGDHGEGLGDHVERTHGYTLYNVTQRVPLIVHAPGRVQAGTHLAASFPLSDLPATLLDVLGIRNRLAASSHSAMSALNGGELADRACYFATDDPYLQNGWSPLRGICLGDWKYIRTTEPELYDLGNDFGEMQNLSDTNTEKLAEMDGRLKELEAGMSVGEADQVQLSSGEINALRSLGYIGGASPSAPAAALNVDTLPDVKEMLPLDVRAEEAQKLLTEGRIEEAIAELQRNVEQSRWHLASQVFLGEALEHSGQSDAAMELYKQVLSLKPDHTDALIHLGAMLSAREEYERAIPYFDEALRVDPSSSAARFNVALSLARLGNLRESIQHLEKLLDDDPYFPGALTALGNARLAMGDRTAAIAAFRREAKQNSKSVEARMNLAVLTADSDAKQAQELLNEALRIAPNNPNVHFNLGAFCLMRGHPAAAIGHLEETLRLQPNHPRAASELERAKKALQDPSR